MNITIAADPGGVTLKDAIKAHLESLGHQVTDKGSQANGEKVLYTVVGDVVAKDIQSGAADVGIAIVDTFLGTKWKADADEPRAKRLEGFLADIRAIEDAQFKA